MAANCLWGQNLAPNPIYRGALVETLTPINYLNLRSLAKELNTPANQKFRKCMNTLV
jgi:hypothetical protein